MFQPKPRLLEEESNTDVEQEDDKDDDNGNDDNDNDNNDEDENAAKEEEKRMETREVTSTRKRSVPSLGLRFIINCFRGTPYNRKTITNRDDYKHREKLDAADFFLEKVFYWLSEWNYF